MYGTSGGALTGCLLFLDIDLDALAEYVYICAAKARSSWRGAFYLRDYCRGAITQFCTKDAHKILQGRFEISITRLFPWYKNLRVNQFPSYEFLVQSLLCSACITPLAGLPMWLPGHGLCFDGGVSDLQLLKGLARNGTFCKLHCRKTNPKNLVVVCPFYSSRADIRPSKYVPMWWAFSRPSRTNSRSSSNSAKRTRTRGQISRTKPRPAARPDRARKATRARTTSGSGVVARRRRRRAARTAPPRGRRRGDRRDPDPRWVRDGGDTARGTPNPRAVARREGARRSSRSLPRARR